MLDCSYGNLRRTFTNLVLVLDVRGVRDLNADEGACRLQLKKTCPCATFFNPTDSKILNRWIPLYHQYLFDVVNSHRYDRRDDLTVVAQPFTAHTRLPQSLSTPIGDKGNLSFSAHFALR